MASTQDQTLAVEHPALGVIAQIEGHGVEAAGIMDVVQTVMRDRDKLALVVGRSRRLGIPSYLSRPQHVALAVAHAVYVALEVFVGVDRHVACKIVIRSCVVEQVVASILCLCGLLQKMSQHGGL